MADNPAVASAEPERPRSADTPRRSRWKKVLAVTVLFVIGAALLALGFHIYPRLAEASAATFPSVSAYSKSSYVNSNIGGIYYAVEQVHPDLARVTVQVFVGGGRWPPGADLTIGLSVVASNTGHDVAACSPDCTVWGAGAKEYSTGIADFKALPESGIATADFLVQEPDFGATADGVTAEATFPEVTVSGLASGPQAMSIQYYNGIPSAPSYDWSSYPPQHLDSSGAQWVESIAKGTTVSRSVVGTDHAAQQRDSNFTLVAGILFGIGGSALIAAFQEWIHD
jgi:hypothetical protein